MRKLKLMTIVGTRPEIIKMSAIIKKADKYFDQVLVHTGQNYDYTLNEVFFKDLGLREPDYYLGVVGDNLGQTMGNVISKSYELMAEVLKDVLPQIEASTILDDLGLEKGKYILLSAHREENIDIEANFLSLMSAVNIMAETYNMPVLYSCHPRSQKMIEQRGFKFNDKVIQHKPLGFFDYNKLQQNAFCVVSDSGTVPEEGAFFGFPAVSIRTSTERPEAMDKGVFTIGSITSDAVCQAVELAVAMHENGDDAYPVPAYTDENVSTKVIKLIQSYVGIVNKMIWRK